MIPEHIVPSHEGGRCYDPYMCCSCSSLSHPILPPTSFLPGIPNVGASSPKAPAPTPIIAHEFHYSWMGQYYHTFSDHFLPLFMTRFLLGWTGRLDHVSPVRVEDCGVENCGNNVVLPWLEDSANDEENNSKQERTKRDVAPRVVGFSRTMFALVCSRIMISK